jgi:hypothetical protein
MEIDLKKLIKYNADFHDLCYHLNVIEYFTVTWGQGI